MERKRRDPNKLSLRNKITDYFLNNYNGNLITLDELFYTFRSMPAIIEKNKIGAIRLLKKACYEAADELRKCGILVLVKFSPKHHHEVMAYKIFDPESKEDILLLKLMQHRRVNRVQATTHITMDQIEIATGMGMSLEEYNGILIEEKAVVRRPKKYLCDGDADDND